MEGWETFSTHGVQLKLKQQNGLPVAGNQSSQVYQMNYVLTVLVLTLGQSELSAGFWGEKSDRVCAVRVKRLTTSAVAMRSSSCLILNAARSEASRKKQELTSVRKKIFSFCVSSALYLSSVWQSICETPCCSKCWA